MSNDHGTKLWLARFRRGLWQLVYLVVGVRFEAMLRVCAQVLGQRAEIGALLGVSHAMHNDDSDPVGFVLGIRFHGYLCSLKSHARFRPIRLTTLCRESDSCGRVIVKHAAMGKRFEIGKLKS